MAEIVMWIGIVGLVLSMVIVFIPMIYTYILLQKPPSKKSHLFSNIPIVELGFILFVSFMILAICGAFLSSELGQSIIKAIK